MTIDRRIAAEKFPSVLGRLGAAASIAAGGVICVALIRGTDEQSAWAQARCDPTHIAADDGDVLKRSELGNGSIFIGACAPGWAEISFSGGPRSRLADVDRQTRQTPPWYSGETAFDPCTFAGGSDIPRSSFRVIYTSSNPAANIPFTGYLAPDREPPTLTTTSVPRKGSLVWPGVMISVDMDADERNGPVRKGWQSGVKKIQLMNESQGMPQEVPPSYQNDQPMQPCRQKMWQNSTRATYTVPRNPPRVIRLVARAWDLADNKEEDIGEFPTGDWFGTITASVTGSIFNDTAVITFGIQETAEGIRGRGHVTVSSGPATIANCTWTRTISRREFDVPITGSRIGDNLRLVLNRRGPETTWQHFPECNPPGIGPRPPVTRPENALAVILDHNEAIIVPARDGWEAALPITPIGDVKFKVEFIIHRTRR